MTMIDKQAEKAFRYAAKHPTHLVVISRGSSQGDYLWHLRADGTRCCETEDDVDIFDKKEVMRRLGSCKGFKNYTHIVFVSEGKRFKI